MKTVAAQAMGASRISLTIRPHPGTIGKTEKQVQPTLTSPAIGPQWSRYIDSRLRQFGSR
jgi:hypothetical protein